MINVKSLVSCWHFPSFLSLSRLIYDFLSEDNQCFRQINYFIQCKFSCLGWCRNCLPPIKREPDRDTAGHSINHSHSQRWREHSFLFLNENIPYYILGHKENGQISSQTILMELANIRKWKLLHSQGRPSDYTAPVFLCRSPFEHSVMCVLMRKAEQYTLSPNDFLIDKWSNIFCFMTQFSLPLFHFQG